MKKYVNQKWIASCLAMTSILIGFNACSDWLDVIPDGTATIEMAFNSRAQTIKYLATCYSYMPKNGNVFKVYTDPTLIGSDELYANPNAKDVAGSTYMTYMSTGVKLAMGLQNATEPLFDYWDLWFQALRHCNVFLENVGRVPDLTEPERKQWVAEVKVLKAYYHFILVQMYGPIPCIRENLPMDASVTAVKVVREPVDDCFQYIVELLDEATKGNDLRIVVSNETTELGHITKPIALAIKAKVLVTAASPLYNGNTQMASLRNNPPDGRQLFNQTPDNAKWQKAALACKEAIEISVQAERKLYRYENNPYKVTTDTMQTQMSLRNAFTLRWNSEIIWGNTQSICRGDTWQYDFELQSHCAPTLERFPSVTLMTGYIAATLKTCRLFYTDHGVPLEDDKTRNINDIYAIRTAQAIDKLYIKEGSETVDLHFDREPRFYAWIGFDRGIWYGAGRYDERETLFSLATRYGEIDRMTSSYNTVGGILPKKFQPFDNKSSASGYLYTPYPWPLIRLSDLYLLYAEAINEAEGPTGPNNAEMFDYIDRVRNRAGLNGVKASWNAYGKNRKYETKEGMREIIQRERTIELMFEGQRFWDVRRWKTALTEFNGPVESWQDDTFDTKLFYVPNTKYMQKFSVRDYFWPIRNSNINNNPNLVQNIGW